MREVRALVACRGLALLVLGLLAACAAPPPPNVVVVLVDTLRADHTSLAGYARDTTPNLSRIAAEGLVLEAHHANAPWTKPSVASILTGLHPSAHGSRLGQFETLQRIAALRAAGKAPQVEVLSPKLDTMAELLERHGWDTKAFVSNYHMTPKFGYDQGYRDYEFVVGVWDDQATMRDCIDAVPGAGGPVFVWCHLMAVHQYDAPKDFPRYPFEAKTPVDQSLEQLWAMKRFHSVEEGIATYDRAIAFDDSLIGKLFDHIRAKAPNTILIVTSDHGEEFGEHGGFEHGRTLYDEMLHVPFVMWGPGVPRGVRVAGLTDSIDVLPTVLTLVGLDVPAYLRGRPIVRDGAVTGGKRESFAEQHHRGPERRQSLIRDGHKLIVSERKSDGAERVEVYAEGQGPETAGSGADVSDREEATLRRRLDHERTAAQRFFDEHVGDSE